MPPKSKSKPKPKTSKLLEVENPAPHESEKEEQAIVSLSTQSNIAAPTVTLSKVKSKWLNEDDDDDEDDDENNSNENHNEFVPSFNGAKDISTNTQQHATKADMLLNKNSLPSYIFTSSSNSKSIVKKGSTLTNDSENVDDDVEERIIAYDVKASYELKALSSQQVFSNENTNKKINKTEMKNKNTREADSSSKKLDKETAKVLNSLEYLSFI